MHISGCSRFGLWLTTVLVAGAILLAVALPAYALEKATVQLKWKHHFQFAGYYAALEKGFYRDAGLDVTILEGGPSTDVEGEVASGKVDFGIGTSALLLKRAEGQDFVVLGQVFQHSPAVLLTLRASGIRTVRDMAGRRFMVSENQGDLLALLKRNGIEENRITKVPHQGDPRDLIRGKADVMVAYSFNEPFVMEQAGEPYLIFSPRAMGIDFYGDNFFTTGRLARGRPKFVGAFREATLRGWRYALDNKKEIVDLIRTKYSRGMSREWLMFEANQVDDLVQQKLVEIGYQSPSRWQYISDAFADLGMLPKGFYAEPIMYEPEPAGNYKPLITVIGVAAIVISLLAWLVMTFRNLSMKLSTEIEERKGIELQLTVLNETLETRVRDRTAALHASEEQFRSLANSMPGFVWTARPDGVVDFWNRFGLDYLGVERIEHEDDWQLQFVHPDDRNATKQLWREAVERGHNYQRELRYRRSDSQYRWHLSRGVPHFDAQGRIDRWYCTSIDINDLREAQRDRNDLALKLALAEERERYRIAGELHDQVAPILLLSRMKVNALASMLPQDDGEYLVGKIDSMLEQAVQDIKLLTFQLRPPILANAGLISALKWLVEEFKLEYGLQTKMTGDMETLQLKSDVSSVVFQVVRELLFNIVKHAGTKNADIRLRRDDGTVIITVADEGNGFNVMHVLYSGKEPAGFGLINIREKIEYFGGRMDFDSSPGNGTRVTFTVPTGSETIPHGRQPGLPEKMLPAR